MKRIIAHLDMDAFFASVEERYTPAFRGKPLVVGSDPKGGSGRGVVSTANYKAREYGIHSAMPISKAWRASEMARLQGKPAVIFLPVDFELYDKSSASIFRSIKNHAKVVEQASIDEFYFDLSFLPDIAVAEELCRQIKSEIRELEKITCSIGIGSNKLIAKIAAGVNKPDGMRTITEEEATSFLDPLPIRALPGIGEKMAEHFYGKNMFTVSDIKKRL